PRLLSEEPQRGNSGSAMNLISLATVFLLSMAPVGGLGAAIPAGITLGLPPALVIFAAVLASSVPALVLPPLCSLATSHPSIPAWVEKRRTDRARRFFESYGLWGMATLGRFVIGPYASVLTLELFGVKRRRAFVAFSVGSFVLALGFTFVTLGGLSLLS